MKAKHVIPVVLVILLLGGGLLVLVGGLYGGPEGLWLNIKPPPNFASLSDERAEAFDSLKLESDTAVKDSPLKRFAEARHDLCFRGENNWKIEQGFAHRCEAKLTRYYGFNADFRQMLVDLDRQLISAGWVNSTHRSTEEMLKEKFDGDYHQPWYDGAIKLVSDLPKPRYESGEKYLRLDFAERLTKPTDLRFLESFQRISLGSGNPEFEKENKVKIGPLFSRVTQEHEYVVAISIESTYFQS